MRAISAMTIERGRTKIFVLASLTGVALALGVALRAQVAPSRKPPRKDASAAPAAPAEIAMPFRVGEKLDYRITWSAFPNAAELQTSIPERRELFGWQTWHFRAAFHTTGSVRKLFAIDDQFDSYTDRATLECRQFESYLNELGKTETNVMHLVASGQPRRAPGGEVVVAAGTRDPLGMLFTLRGADWQHMPELRAPVYNGQDIYEMRARLENASETVTVDAGNFRASRIAIRVFQYDKEVTAIHFTLWIANDAAHTPVLVAATLPFGDLRVELTRQAANANGPAPGR